MLVGNYFFRNKGCSGSTLLLRFGVAILLILSNSVANAGVANSCEDQSKCISLTASEVVDNSGECKVKVCLEPTFVGNCSKSLSETMSHTCIKDTYHGDGFAGATAKTGVRDGEIQCQIVPAGTDAQFLLKDGGGCTKDGGETSLDDTIDGFDASCQPRPDDVESCTGNKVGVECIWNVTALDLCSPPSPSVSRAPSGIPSSVPSKSPSVSPAPTPTPEVTEDPCPLADEFPIEGTVPGSATYNSFGSSCYVGMTSESIAYRNVTSISFDYRAKVCGAGCVDGGSCGFLSLGVYDSLNANAPFISVSMIPFGSYQYSYNTGSETFSEFLPASDDPSESTYRRAKNCMWITIERSIDRFNLKYDYLLGDIVPGNNDTCKECCEDEYCYSLHPNPQFCESFAFGSLPPFDMSDDVILTLEVEASSEGKFRDFNYPYAFPLK